jgi:hypothetical protein
MGREMVLYSNGHDTLPHSESLCAFSLFMQNHLAVALISFSCQAIAILLSWQRNKPGPAATVSTKKRGTSIDMSRQTKRQAALQHLRGLVNQPVEQARYTLEVLA